jgi:tetratricopeptide (TPR) repeat protein
MNAPRRLDEPSARLVAENIAQLSSEEGLHELGVLLDKFPDDARLLFLRGSLHADVRDYEAAATDFGRSVEKDPAFHIARFQYGLLLLCLDRTERARQVWEPLDALNDDDCLLLFKRGLCALIDGDVERGVATLQAGQRANAAFPPLNGDIQQLIDRARAQTDAAQAPGEEHLLLGTYRKGFN